MQITPATVAGKANLPKYVLAQVKRNVENLYLARQYKKDLDNGVPFEVLLLREVPAANAHVP